MATPIRIKRSAVSGKRPQLTDLQVGELALNTYDGSLFTERDTGGVGIATTVSNLTPWTESYGASSISYLNSVGIGTNSPESLLHLQGTGGNTSGLHFENGAGETLKMFFGSNTSNSQFSLNYGGTGQNELIFTHDGNIITNQTTGSLGVGTYNPSASSKLDVFGHTELDDLNVSGVSTFVGNAQFDGNVSIGGTLTYEDVTNIDAVGLITAQSGIRVTGGVIEAQAGENKIPSLYANLAALPNANTYHGMFAHVHSTGKGYYAHGGNWIELVNKDTSGNVALSGDLDVDGHTELDNLNVSGVSTFNDNVTIGNAAGISANANADNLVLGESSGNQGITILSGQSATGNLFFGDSVNSSAAGIQYFHTDNHMEFRIAGGEKVRFTSGGFVGIGTEAPSHKLEVNGGSSLKGNLSVTGVSTFTGKIIANSDIGIGVNNPSQKLDIRDSDPRIQLVDTDNNENIQLRNNQGNFILSATKTSIFSGGGQKVLITSDGDVGINTNNPAGKLHISSGTSGDCELIIEADTDNSNESDNPRIIFRQDGGQDQSAVGTENNELVLSNSVSGGGIVFKTGTSVGYANATEKLRITSDGDVGIGTNNPTEKLHLVADSAFQILLKRGGASPSEVIFGNENNTARISNNTNGIDLRTGSTPSSSMLIDQNGNVGIGTDDPGAKLDVHGNSRLNGDLNVSGIATIGSGGSGQAVLQYGGSTKLNTANWGVSVAGTLQSTNFIKTLNQSSSTDGKSIFLTNTSGNLLEIGHTSNNSFITGHVGNININASTVAISTNMTVGGVSTFFGNNGDDAIIAWKNINLDSNSYKLQLGNYQYLQIYHKIGDSYVGHTTATGDLNLQSARNIYISPDTPADSGNAGGGPGGIALQFGRVEIYDGSSLKFRTTSTGAVVSGILTASSFSGSLSGIATGADKVYVDESEDDNKAYNIIFTDEDPDGGNSYHTLQVDNNGLTFNPGTNVLAANAVQGTSYMRSGKYYYHNDITTFIDFTGGGDFLFKTADTTRATINDGGLDISGALNVSGIATFQGNVSIAGTLTYEDVTNIDSIGIITARSGIEVGTGTTLQSSTTVGTGKALRIISPSGYIDVGSQNTSYAHFYTDRQRFYFNKRLIVDEGIIGSFNEDLKLATDQTEERIIIKSDTGNVGIGTNSPQTKLHLRQGTDNNTDGFRISRTNSAATYSQYIDTSSTFNIGYSNPSTDDPDPQITLNQIGYVGIGTNLPQALLNVASNSPNFRITDLNSSAGAGNTSYTQLTNINGNTYVYTRANENNGNYLIGGQGNGVFDEFIRITHQGKVGIGTNNPQTALDIYATPIDTATLNTTNCKNLGLWVRAKNPSNTTGNIYTGITLGEGRAGLYAYDDGGGAAHGMGFWTGSNSGVSEKLRITKDGDVGIGTDTPVGARLRVHKDGLNTTLQQWGGNLGSTTGQRFMQLYSPATDSGNDYFRFQTGNAFKFQVDTIDALCINSAGDIGIGTDSVDAKLHVENGTVWIDNNSGDTTTRSNTLTVSHTHGATFTPGVDPGDARRIASFITKGATKAVILSMRNLDDGNAFFDFVADGNTDKFYVQGNAARAAGLGPAITLDTSNNIGIGTNDPIGTNALAGNTATLAVGILTANTIYGNVVGGLSPTGNIFIGGDLDVDGDTDLDVLNVSDTATFSSNLIANVNVGIGSAIPQAKLDILARGDTQKGIRLLDSNAAQSAPYIEVIGKRSDGNSSQGFGGKIHLAKNRTGDKINNGSMLGAVAFGGNHTDGTEANILYTASISAVASDSFDSATDMPTDLIFLTGSTGKTPTAVNTTTGTERLRIKSDGGTALTRTHLGGRRSTDTSQNYFKIGTWKGFTVGSRAKITIFGTATFNSGENVAGETVIYLALAADETMHGHFHSISHTRPGVQKVIYKLGNSNTEAEIWIKYELNYAMTKCMADVSLGTWEAADVNTGSTNVATGATDANIDSRYAIFTSNGTSSKERFRVSNDGSVTITDQGGLANTPSLQVDNNISASFIHTMQALTPNITAGQQNIILLGRQRSVKNTAFIGYKYSGAAGSNDNLFTINHWGSEELLTVNGQGDTAIAGVLKVTSGQVGIGTVSPLTDLHIHSGTPRITMSDSGTGAHHRINADSSVGNLAFDVDYNSVTTNPAFVVNVKGAEQARVSAGGSLAVGTSDAKDTLTIADPGIGNVVSLRIVDPTAATYGAHFSFYDTQNEVRIGGINDSTKRAVLRIHRDSPSDVLFVSSLGRLGVGNTNPTSKLHVTGDAKISGVVTATSFESTVATGTAPFVVASTTKVTNLNADLLDGKSTANGAAGNTVVIRNAAAGFSAADVNFANLNVSGVSTFTGNVSIAGTLTYEDVTNVDAIGLITARNGIHVTGAGVSVTGISTFINNVEFQDSIGVGTPTPSNNLHVVGTSKIEGAATFNNDVTISRPNTATLTVETSALSSYDALIKIRGARTGLTNDTSMLQFDNSTNAPYTLAQIAAQDPAADHTQGKGQLIFRTNSGFNIIERMRIQTGGNVGIGTNNPSAQLHIGPKDGDATPHLYLASANNDYGFRIDTDDLLGGNVPLRIFARFNGTDTERIRVNQNGNVGINSSIPLHKLDIRGDINFNNNMLISHAEVGNANNIDHIWHSDIANYGTGGTWNFVSDGTAKRSGNSAIQIGYLKSGLGGHLLGDVGIGTTNPQARLDIDGNLIGNGNVGFGTVTNSDVRLKVTHDGLNKIIQQWGGYQGSTAGHRFMELYSPPTDDNSDYFKFQTGNAIKFRIDGTDVLNLKSDYKVGIGTDNPDRIFHVMNGSAGSVTADSNAVMVAENSDHTIIQMLSPANKSNRIMFGDPGDTNAGQISYDHNIDTLQFQVNGSEAFRIGASGELSVTGVTTISAGSFGNNVTTGGRTYATNVDLRVSSLRCGVVVRNMNDYRTDNTYNSAFMVLDPYTNVAKTYAFRAAEGTGPNNLAGSTATLADTFWVKTNGDGYFSGDVGIGTTSTSKKFEVYTGSSSVLIKGNNSGALHINPNSTGGGQETLIGQANGDLRLLSGSGGYQADRANILLKNSNKNIIMNADAPTGVVGIGTDSPDHQLHVVQKSTDSYGTGVARFEFYDTDDSGGDQHYDARFIPTGTYIKSFVTGAGTDFLIVDQDNTAGRKSFAVESNAGNRKTFTVDSAGNIGIGNDDPAQRLHIDNGSSPKDDGGILVQNVLYAANQDKPYLIIGSQNWTGATTNWGTYGFQHRIKVDGTGTPRITIDNPSGEIIAFTSGKKVGIGVTNPTHLLQVNGSFAATTKSFVIDHPTKEGMKLRHGSLEGPENGVYVRGRLKDNNKIELPDYWTGLVDEDTITVNLTPIGSESTLHKVIDIYDNTVVVGSEDGNINCFYTVFGERKDVEKMEVEY